MYDEMHRQCVTLLVKCLWGGVRVVVLDEGEYIEVGELRGYGEVGR